MAGLHSIRGTARVVRGVGLPIVPMRRSECRGGVRPCPYITCSMHLANDDDGSGTVRVDLVWYDRIIELLSDEYQLACMCVLWWLAGSKLRDTCALDVAERGEATVYEMAQAMGIWHSNVAPALESGCAKAREAAARMGVNLTMLPDADGSR